MRVVGITAEYNPFHKGHKYHLEKARELSGANVAIVVMSGDFIQRGEVAIADKWIRSEMAVKSGADLVIELPFLFACNRAEVFASAAVDFLVAAGATDIAFGCETDDFDGLKNATRGIIRESQTIDALAREFMKEGISYAKANERAVKHVLGDSAVEFIREPNNILAVEYMKRGEYYIQRGKDINYLPIKRVGSGYRNVNPEEGFAGAAAIRGMDFEEMKKYLPEESWALLEDLVPLHCRDDEMFRLLRGIVMRGEPEELARIYSVGEGFENKLKKEIRDASHMNDLMERLVSARYTAAAVRRMLVYTLLNVTGENADSVIDAEGSAAFYLRVLAAGQKGREHLKLLKKSEGSPEQITNVNKYVPVNDIASKMIDWDLAAADMYNLLSGVKIRDFSDRVRKPYIEQGK